MVILVPGEPVGQPRHRCTCVGGKARAYDPGTADGWKGAVELSARLATKGRSFDGPVTLRITYVGNLGATLGAPVDVTLAPGEWRQLDRPLEAFGAAVGYAKVERISGTSRFLAYGVLNDAATSDGSYVGMSF